MTTFTKQEKTIILFLAASLFFGSLFLLIKKKDTIFSRLIFPAFERIVRKIKINSATQEEWESLPGIGVYRANMIMQAREKRGRFSSIEDVRYVKGIGPYVFNQIKDYLDED